MSLRIAATALRAPRCRGRRGPYSPQGSAAFRHAPCLRQRAVPLATDVPSAFGGPCDSTPEPKFRSQRRRAATGNNDSPIPAAILKARQVRVVPGPPTQLSPRKNKVHQMLIDDAAPTPVASEHVGTVRNHCGGSSSLRGGVTLFR